MDPSQVKIPPMKDLTVDNITENVIRINSLCEDERMKYVLERLVSHLHDFARETRLSSQEWMAGLMFLTEVGKICSDVRQVTEVMPHGDSMSHDPKGEPLLVVCTLKDTNGNPISDVKIDIWETDSTGHYDVQYADRNGPDGRFKDSLVVDLGKAGPEYAKKYGVSEDHALLTYDFVLVSDAETSALRERNSKVALDKLGRKVKIVNGLPVPDLD
ncbi:unnamed protein product [Aspergillus oryzae var. brunneus]|uniref:Unnamed protein product n=2 Tax=Aspergillus oryzae TaxID=5062 RepID=A0AAN4YWF2_ASPOZ|nr:unnamed protein product [Aspergillus oryzae]GMG51386.1 unnamed protein product [Aspergillus oryzae var. brunneus]